MLADIETFSLFLRRNTHAAVGAWSEGGKNHALMKNLDADGDGEVDLEEFVNYSMDSCLQTHRASRRI